MYTVSERMHNRMCLWILSCAKTKTIFKKIFEASSATLNRLCSSVFSIQWATQGLKQYLRGNEKLSQSECPELLTKRRSGTEKKVWIEQLGDEWAWVCAQCWRGAEVLGMASCPQGYHRIVGKTDLSPESYNSMGDKKN